MALGGGFWSNANKVIPGAYINFVSAARAASRLSARGTAAIAMPLSWGTDNEIFKVTAEDFVDNALNIFGYSTDAPEMKYIRELFRHATTVYFYKLGGGTKATTESGLCTIKHGGKRGNDVTVSIVKNTDSSFEVTTRVEGKEVDTQTVKLITELIDNDFVIWADSGELTASVIAFKNGADAQSSAYQAAYTAFLEKIGQYSFNAIGCISDDSAIREQFIAFTKDMRDAQGVKFQCVLYKAETANYEGIISVENAADLVYWTLGACAACAINRSLDNELYDGELTFKVDYSQQMLKKAIQDGKFMFHRVGDEIHVLMDVNTLTTFTKEKGKDFASNQTIRILDQIGMDIAATFNSKYVGKIQNNTGGRESLWMDIVTYHKELETVGAIENFNPAHITVSAVEDNKKAVSVAAKVQIVNSMAYCYMTVYVS